MASPNITVQIKGGTTQVVTAPKIQVAGGSSNAFGVVNVAGQNNIIANIGSDTLHLVAGSGITLTTDNVNKSLTIVAAGSSALDQFARDQANAAFNKANTANVTGQAAFDKANSAIYTAAQIRANISNTTPINYDAATGIISHANSGAVATTYGNTTFTPTITVDAKGHITSISNTAIALPPGSDQFARDQANAAFNQANAAYANANTAIYTAAQIRANISNTAPINYDATTGTISHALSGATASGYGDAATVPKIVVDDKGHVTSVVNTAIAITASQVTSGILSVARGGTGKDATGLVNGSILAGNTVNVGFDLTTIAQTNPVIVVNGKGTITLSHASSGVTASGYGTVNQIPVFVVDTFGHITAVTNTAIGSLDAGAITTGTLVVARGGTGQSSYTNGQILIGNTGSTGLDKATIAQSAPVIVTNLQGSITISHARSGVVALDSYGSSSVIPVLAIDANGHITAAVNTTISIATSQIASGILSVARGGTGKDATGLANGQLLIGNTVNTGFDLTTIAQTAPVIVTNGKGTVTLSHASSGVTATGYGTGALVPVFVVDAFGHITSVTNTAIGSLDAGVITTGTLVVARGGTGQSSYTNGQILIGNTGSTGLDRAVLTQTAPVIVTNLQGSITLSHASSGVVASGYGDAATVPKVVVDDKGHVTSVTNTAIAISAAAITSGTLIVGRGGTGQTAITVNGSLLIGNTVSGGFDVNPLTQGTGILITNDKGSISISATGGSAIDQYARDKANGAAQNSFVTVNVAGQSDIVADSNTDTLTIVGSGITITTNAGTDTLTIQHPASGVVASGYGDAATVPKIVVDANGHTTSVTNTSIAIAASQVTSGILQVARGGTGKDATGLVNGVLLIGNTVNTGFDLTTIAQTAPVIVTNGKGTITLSHASSGVTATGYGTVNQIPVFVVDVFGHITAVTNTSIGTLDAGVITTGTLVVARGGTGQSSYTNGQILIGNTGSTGLDKSVIAQSAPVIVTNLQGSITISHARSGVTAVDSYGSSAIIPVLAIDANGHITAAVNTSVAISAAAVTSGILQVARGGTGKDATGLANGQLLIGNTVNTGFDLTTIAQTAPVIVVNGKGTITLSHASSGVVATGYGTATQVPVFVVDVFGHITAVTNTAITGLDAGVITTGTLVVARGGTGQSSYTNGQILIGNTGSTGLDKATIAQTAPIIVTNLQGSITLSHASTAVVTGTYGGSNRVIGYTVDQFGHLTAASNVAIDLLPAASITTGIISVARGGTGKDATGLANGQLLIGNTVNAGFDLATVAQTAPVIVTNGKGTITLSHASSGVTATGYGTLNQIPVFVVDVFGHITSVTNTTIGSLDTGVLTTGILSVARGGTGKDATGLANGQLLIGNTVNTGFDLTTIAQTAPVIVVNGKGTITLSHASSGVVATGYGTAALIPVFVVDAFGHVTSVTNTAIAGLSTTVLTSGILPVARGGTGKDATGLANGQILIGNTVNTGFDLATVAQSAPVIVTNGQGTITISHARSGVTAATYGGAAIVPVVIIDANGHITTATNTNIGIAASQITSGATVNGQILIGNTVSGAFDVSLIAQTAPVIVTNGKGTVTLSHASSGVTATGYGTAAQIPVFVVDAFGHITSVTNTAITGLSTTVLTSGILSVARGGTGKDATGLANGQLLIGNTVNTGFDLTTIAQSAPVIVTNGQGTITISHARSGVTATGYGDPANIPVFVVDANGHVTSVTNTAIAISAAAITSGILTVARGGTGKDATGIVNGSFLIGNTVNTGFDISTIAQTAPVIVTNGKGTVTLSHASSGVTATGYGTGALIPAIVVDVFGHITSVTNTSIAIAASQVTSGILSVARGGTGKDATGLVNGALLIGNTVNTGFDLTTLIQGSGIIITNGKGTIQIDATGGAATDQFARDTANGAFTKANGAAQNSFVTWHVLGGTANTQDIAMLDTGANFGEALLGVSAINTPGANGALIATRWSANNGGFLNFVKADISSRGNTSLATFTYWVTLESDNGSGNTTGTILATSTSYNAFIVPLASSGAPAGGPSSPNFLKQFDFPTPYTLIAGVNYWIILRGDYPKSDASHLFWNMQAQTAPPNNLSKSLNFDTTNWTTATGALGSNFIFQAWVNTLGADVVADSNTDIVNLIAGTGISITPNSVSDTITINATSTGASIKQTELVFGTTPVDEKSFTVTDAAVTAASLITGSIAYKAPTGKDLDEVDMDSYHLSFAPGTGQLTVFVRALDGYVTGNVFLNYTLY